MVRKLLVAVVAMLGLGFFFFKTETGWMYFYSFGRFPGHMRAAVEPHGLSLQGADFGMVIGFRRGFCRFEADEATVEAFVTRARAAGIELVEHPTAEDLQLANDPEARAELAHTWTELLDTKEERADRGRRLLEKRARAWNARGQLPVSGVTLDGLHLYYDRDTHEGLLITTYAYG